MVRWGIVGIGRIADTEIAPAITTSPHGELRGVVSRDQGRAGAVAACEEAAVQLGITFQTRFHDSFGRFREVVQDGSLGAIRVVQVEMSPGRTLLKGWRT